MLAHLFLLVGLQLANNQIMIFPYVEEDDTEPRTLKNETDALKNETGALKNESRTLKNETRTLYNETKTLHNEKSTLKASPMLEERGSKKDTAFRPKALQETKGFKKNLLQNAEVFKPLRENVSFFDSHGVVLSDEMIKQKVARAKNIMELKFPQHLKPEAFLTEEGADFTIEKLISDHRNKATIASSKTIIEQANVTSTYEAANETKATTPAPVDPQLTPSTVEVTTTPRPLQSPVANLPTTHPPTTTSSHPATPQDYGNILVSGPKNISEESSQRDEVENESLLTLTDALQKDVLTNWVYKDYIKSPADLMLDQGLINRAKISVSSGNRLRSVFERALQGHNVNAALITSAVTRAFANDPASQKWLYPNALLDWWQRTVTPTTNSSISYKDVSLAGYGNDYFSRCLKNHLPDNGGTDLILWELSGSDYKSHGKLRPLDAQSLERFLRNTLEYHSNPDLIILNFFRGNSMNRSAYCRELDEDSESKLAKHYDCTALSWSKSVCPYLTDDEEGFSFSYLFSRDKIHPSIIGHAQMAYILIDYIRDEFLNFLREPKPVETRSFSLPKAIFTQVFKPLCFTTLKTAKAVQQEAGDSDLPVIFISPDPKDEAIHRSKISNLTNLSNAIVPIIMRFTINDKDPEDSFRTIGILPSFNKPLKTVARLDNKPFVPLKVADYSPGQLIEIKPAVRLSKGAHMLRLWSLDKRFKVVALTLDTVHKSSCSVTDDTGCWN